MLKGGYFVLLEYLFFSLTWTSQNENLFIECLETLIEFADCDFKEEILLRQNLSLLPDTDKNSSIITV